MDCVVTDPPYGETDLNWDTRVCWLPEVRRILKPHGSVWFFTSVRHLLSVDLASWRFAQAWEKQSGTGFASDRFKRVHELAVQTYPEGVKWADVYKSPVCTLEPKKIRVYRNSRAPHLRPIGGGPYQVKPGFKLVRSVMRVRNCNGYAVHPTRRPVDIVTPLLQYSCAPGGLVLDPFAGSGTTAIAARGLGLSFVGFELNAEYCALAHERNAA